MAYARTERRSGSGGAVVVTVVVVLLLGAVAGVVWWKASQFKKPPPEPTGPAASLNKWKARYRLYGELPEPLPAEWRLSMEAGPKWQAAGSPTAFPTAWVDFQIERDRVTAVSVATYRGAQCPAPIDLILDLAGEAEGRTLMNYVGEMPEMPENTGFERQSTLYRFFGWRLGGEDQPRRSLVCIALKDGGPRTDEFLAKVKADWEALPKKPPEPKKAPAPAGAPKPEPPKEPAKPPPAESAKPN